MTQITAADYKNPAQVVKNDKQNQVILVVGAGASGVQIAQELAESTIENKGIQVMISVGRHCRWPRSYRGKDILWWMDATGRSDEHIDEVDDAVRVRRVPSPQLIGTPDRRTVDINTLIDIGVELVGRVCNIRDGICHTSGDLRNLCKMADLKGNRLLRSIDNWVEEMRDESESIAAIAESS